MINFSVFFNIVDFMVTLKFELAAQYWVGRCFSTSTLSQKSLYELVSIILVVWMIRFKIGFI